MAVLHPAAGIHIPCRQDRQMTVPAVASAVDHAVLHRVRDPEFPGLIFVQRPQMVFLIKVRLTSRRLILLKLFITVCEQFPVTQRLDPHILLLTGRTVSRKGKHIHPGSHNSVDDSRDLINICPGNRRHHHRPDSRPVDASDLFQRDIKTSRFPEPVMRFPQTVNRKLILFTAAFL